MKSIADWIREQTPGWTDETRYRALSWAHTLLEPVVLLGITSSSFQLLVFTLQLFVVFSQFLLRECLLTLIEREFAEAPCTDLFATLFAALGWTITRSEKMTFNIGFNCGLLLLNALLLLQRSVLWGLWMVAGVLIASLALALLARAHPPPDIDESPPSQIPSPPVSP
jgi:hypothetical protein